MSGPRDPRSLAPVEPSPGQVRRWRMMQPWQAKREEARWRRENGQDPAQQATTPRVQQPHQEGLTGTRRLTNEELARRTARKAELDNPNFTGTLTDEDLKLASPAAVIRMLNSGQLFRDLDGPPPSRR
jgi:hypothetical protein